MSSQPGTPGVEQRRTSARGEPERPAWHLHRFHRVGADPFSSAVLYACRCGVVRSGF